MSKQRQKKTNPQIEAEKKCKAQRRKELIDTFKGKFSKLPRAYR